MLLLFNTVSPLKPAERLGRKLQFAEDMIAVGHCLKGSSKQTKCTNKQLFLNSYPLQKECKRNTILSNLWVAIIHLDMRNFVLF